MSFAELQRRPVRLRAIEALSFQQPEPAQKAAIPAALPSCEVRHFLSD